MNISVHISANTVAWYGAVVATFGAIKVLYDIYNDRRNLRIKILPDMRLVGDKERKYIKDHYLAVSIINKGKRPVKVSTVAIQFKWFDTYVLDRNIFRSIPKTLTEGDPDLTLTIPKKNFDFNKFCCVIVVDATGREYKVFDGLLPTFTRVEYEVRALITRRKTGKEKG